MLYISLFIFFPQAVREQNYPEHQKISTVWEHVWNQKVSLFTQHKDIFW